MFNSETGRSGQTAEEILRQAQQTAVEKRVGAYTISVKVDGNLQEAKDAGELERFVRNGSDVVYNGILVDGKGGVLQ